jgi:TonB family protein
MSLVRVLRGGLLFLLLSCTRPCVFGSAALQNDTDHNGETHSEVRIVPNPDFEIQVVPYNGFRVRRRGTVEWTSSSKIREVIPVGVLDGDKKIYLESKAVPRPKVKHEQPTSYPQTERTSGKEGLVVAHIVVDDSGVVRSTTVDTSTSPAFTKSAVEAVQKWVFEPAKLNGQPVAVL